jgi:hypothetical protein
VTDVEVVYMLLLLLFAYEEKPLLVVASGRYDVEGVFSIKSPAFFNKDPPYFLSSLSFLEFSIYSFLFSAQSFAV